MTEKRIAVFLAAAFVFSGIGGAFVQAAEYPTRPITLHVPWPAGGSADTGARILTSIAE
ncbi:MAG: hypothetical protein NTV04_24010 [Deltaproteobacteria bacterium]|nr:hypothetical protein [Deltaproteobacteria bacterium]